MMQTCAASLYPGLPSQLFSQFFCHGCEKSCEGRPGYEATCVVPSAYEDCMCSIYLGTHSTKTPKEPTESAQPENLGVCVEKLFNHLYSMACVVLQVNAHPCNKPDEVGDWQILSNSNNELL